MDKKRCFLIGHHDAPESIYPALKREIERHITELGVTEFIVGHYDATHTRQLNSFGNR